jgi:protease-4
MGFIVFVLSMILLFLIISGPLLSGKIIKDNPISKNLGLASKNEIAVIYIEGSMVADRSYEKEDVSYSSDVVKCLRKATEDPDVKAIVLRINSPGGTPVAAEEIISQMEKTKKKKPVIVSMGDIATSAAYYVASASNHIVANPDTFTGSIGVIWVFKNRTKYYDEEGINFYIAKSGNYKDIGSDWRGLSENEKEYVQNIINESYERFTGSVAAGRGLPLEDVKSIADGRLYTGTKAKDIGLVDSIGGLYDAIAIAQKMANIKGKVTIVHMNEPTPKNN